MKRDTFLALTLGALLILVAGSASPPLDRARDAAGLHMPNKTYLVKAASEFRLPLWNPHLGLGRPFLADIETATLYPPTLFYVALGERYGLAANLLLHTALAQMGMFALCRALKASRTIAFMLGLVFAFSGPIMGRLMAGQIQYAFAAAYLPLILLLTYRLHQQVTLARIAGLASVLALQFLCGHPQMAWISWFGAGLLLLGARSSPPFSSSVAAFARDCAAFFAALLWGAGIAAAQLMPFFELVSQGNRSAKTLEFAGAFAMPWFGWFSAVSPREAVGGGWENNIYGSLVLTALGLLGLTRVKGALGRGILCMTVVGAVLASGEITPFFSWAYHLVPGLSSFRIPARLAALPALGLLLAAGWVISAAPTHRPSKRLGTVFLICVVTIFSALILKELSPENFPSNLARIVIAAAAVTMVDRGFTAWAHHRFVATVLGFLLALDLGHSIHAWKRAAGSGPVSAVERSLESTLGREELQQPGGAPPRVSALGAVRENAGMLLGYSTYAGYNSLTLDRVWNYMHVILGLEPPPYANTQPLLKIADHGPFPYRSMNLVLGLEPGGQVLRRNEEPDPRAWVAGRWRYIPSFRDALAMMRGGHDGRDEALVEGHIAGAKGGPSKVSPARIVAFEPESVLVETHTLEGGLLILGEAWYPGWRARVNGQDVACLPVNVWMRGVAIPPGQIQVLFYYRSTYLGLGIAISLATAIAALWAFLRGYSRPIPPVTPHPAG